jgi:lipopolysaccharide/colanic/teichoic acid biosynthesis glycosyltransferase
VFGCSAAAALLLLASPLLMEIVIAIFLETGLPLVFRQTRVGQNGNLFTLPLRYIRHYGKSARTAKRHWYKISCCRQLGS